MNCVRKLSVLCLLCVFLAGCTIVRITGPGSVTMLRPGVLAIVPTSGAATVAYRIEGVGVVPGRAGATLGWAREEAVIVGDPTRCQVILFDASKDNPVWRQLLSDNPTICVRGKSP